MARPDRFHEIEIKLRVPDLRVLQRALKSIRAREISPRTYERNTLYDTQTRDLGRRGELIRIRIERPTSNSTTKQSEKQLVGADRAILTHKAPARGAHARISRAEAARARSRFKVKEETEVVVTGARQMDRILNRLGLRPAFEYEKYRTTYLLPRVKGVKIEVDETPIGNYVEVEGSPSAIDRAARLLGYRSSDYVRETYGALYLADCRRRGHKPGNMFFQKAKKLH